MQLFDLTLEYWGSKKTGGLIYDTKKKLQAIECDKCGLVVFEREEN